MAEPPIFERQQVARISIVAEAIRPVYPNLGSDLPAPRLSKDRDSANLTVFTWSSWEHLM